MPTVVVDGGAGGGVGGAGTWSSNLEILDRQGRTSLLAGPSQVTSIPIAQCNPPGTDNGVGTDGPFRTF